MTATAPPYTAPTFPCPRCGQPFTHGTLACPRCGALVYARMLNDLSARAQQEEAAGNPVRAALIWRECLPLLPPDSQQYAMITHRIGALTTGFGGAGGGGFAGADIGGAGAGSAGAGFGGAGVGGAGLGGAGLGGAIEGDPAPVGAMAAPRPPDAWPVAVAKTVGSMLLSIVVYAWLFSHPGDANFGAKFAVGFVLLILVHELGHSFAMRYYGLSASPPIFIPFLGAVINLRQMPRNALEEAVVGIAGPVTGTLAAAATYALYLRTGSILFLRLAEFGFFLNLLNLLPVPPLDGGRVTAAVSPKIWMLGIVGAVAWLVWDFVRYQQFNPILVLLLLFAWPRIRQTLLMRAAGGAYYRIGRPAKIVMGAAYLLLGLSLAAMYFVTRIEARHLLGGGMLD
ncbi:MAG TPA: site-2 protease family protein [Tepidisphaeraceae bacterium]|nr:site-2 protease family protein [Tepidisphaeraceae bacterium]